MQREIIYTASYDSPFGVILLAATEGGLIELTFVVAGAPLKNKVRPAVEVITAPSRFKKQLFPLLDRYFAGKKTSFDIPLDIAGSDFDNAVWEELKKIPYGTTISYGELARRANSPKGARAVGGALGRNPVPIIIPCHRVITSGGEIGGYSAGNGVELKRSLLEIEEIKL